MILFPNLAGRLRYLSCIHHQEGREGDVIRINDLGASGKSIGSTKDAASKGAMRTFFVGTMVGEYQKGGRS